MGGDILDNIQKCDNYAERVKEFSESLTNFFLVFDSLFLFEEDAEQLLNDTKESLEEKILHNESALPLIIAIGGNYDSNIDRAKVKQVDALLELVKARKNLQKAIEKGHKKKADYSQVLALFGL